MAVKRAEKMKRIRDLRNGGRYMDRTCDPYDVNVGAHPYLIDLSTRKGTNAPVSFPLSSRLAGAEMEPIGDSFRIHRPRCDRAHSASVPRMTKVGMEKPTIFSGPMVRGTLDDRKTMTRRLAWQKSHLAGLDFSSEEQEDFELRGWNFEKRGELYYVSKPTAWQSVKPGMMLWVRESFRPNDLYPYDWGRIIYRADVAPDALGPWKPSIHMPRWASRITLEVTAVKVERLRDISEEDAKAEGIEFAKAIGIMGGWIDYEDQRRGGPSFRRYADPRESFRTLWLTIHGPGSWEANPWVVAVTFRRTPP